jgi:DNA-binding MarR family transcriptional regulator
MTLESTSHRAAADGARRLHNAVPPPDEDLERAVLRTLDRVLELVQRRPLSACEFRLLLGLLEHDATISELARALDESPAPVIEAGRRLALRGLVRQRRTGGRRETELGLNTAGLKEIRPLITAASTAGAPDLHSAPHGQAIPQRSGSEHGI